MTKIERRQQMLMLGAIAAEPGGSGCALHKVHNPSVTTLLVHHVYPVDLQINVSAELNPKVEFDRIGLKDHETVLICPTGKLNVDAYISYLLGEGDPLPVRVGRETKALATEAIRRYEAHRACKAAE